MKALITFSIIYIFLNACSHTATKPQQSLILAKWPDGSKKLEKKYKEDTLNYQIISYYQSGKVQDIQTYYKSTLNGISISWYPDGHLSDSTVFQEGYIKYRIEKFNNGQTQREYDIFFIDSVPVLDSSNNFLYAEKHLFGNIWSYSESGELKEFTNLIGDTLFYFRKDTFNVMKKVGYKLKGKLVHEY